ncbi:serine hydrolase domain-containing protein [Cellulomonas triticagri]|uniref:Class A beta-lactamase-related serine hydrolase n=1 Tax=Cellulomonas triticagri TaxID=2483352 RepID=A0A3M2J9G9_9CELL|nr:serine hydrolase domain-containing protein [Cellulomonas triticagri]RMI09564.1 class A beta-lactamase-related serine hydrolase [Cellulomonas triticagri]
MTPDDTTTGPALAVVATGPGGRHRTTVTGAADVVTGAPATTGTAFHLCSSAKLVTAVVVLRLARTGDLALDDDVRTYVPVPVAPTAGRGPTLRELLAHHGGITDPDGAFEPAAVAPPVTVDVAVDRPPGTAFGYSDAGYCLVERAVEAVTGTPFATTAHRLVAEPLGLRSTAFWDGQPATATEDPGLRAALTAVAATAASGHDPAGARVPGARVHYPGLAASGLWGTPDEYGTLLADLTRSWSGHDDAVLLDPADAAAMLRCDGEPGIGLGAFVLAGAHGPVVMTQGWGVGFQGQARAYPADGGALAVLTNQDPGVEQAGSVVGTTLRRLAAERGWAA